MNRNKSKRGCKRFGGKEILKEIVDDFKRIKGKGKENNKVYNNLELKFFTMSTHWQWEETIDCVGKVPVLLHGRERYQLIVKDQRKKDQVEK